MRPSEEGERGKQAERHMVGLEVLFVGVVVVVLMMENLEERDGYKPIQRREQKREMVPKKRKVTDGDEEQAKAPGQETLKKVTRRMKRQADGNFPEST